MCPSGVPGSTSLLRPECAPFPPPPMPAEEPSTPPTCSETPAVRLCHTAGKSKDENCLCLLIYTLTRYQLLCLREYPGCFHDDCLMEINRV